MANELKNQLLSVRPLYASIDEKQNEIIALKEATDAAKAAIDKNPTDYYFREGRFLEEENKRQKKEQEEKIEKFKKKLPKTRAIIIGVYIGFIIFIFAILAATNASDFGDWLLMMLKASFMLALLIIFLSAGPVILLHYLQDTIISFYANRIEKNIDKAALEAARKKDNEEKEKYQKHTAKYKAECQKYYDEISKQNAKRIDVLKREILDLLAEAERTYALPGEFRRLSALDGLINSYDSCSREWFAGKEPRDLKMLIRYYNAYNQSVYDEKYYEMKDFWLQLHQMDEIKRSNARSSQQVDTWKAENRNERSQEKNKRAREDLQDLKNLYGISDNE